ncbi:hypoxanthine phosphoribosyltransferase [candidate division KSB1 bacterium]|nr:hypoxanthine phosphoribosyltransferase [candidate division KSB1 bacterium]
MNNRSEFERVVYDNKFRVLIAREQIDDRIRELGRKISDDYRGKNPIVIGVLNGGFLFMADLIRHIEIDLEIDFIKLSSYGDEKVSSGKVEVLKEINADVKNRHVLLVEDIVDTGLSVKVLEKKFSAFSPASLRFVSLLRKTDKAKVDFDIDYVGFEIPDHFVVGYGLDHKQILRNLPAVYIMD